MITRSQLAGGLIVDREMVGERQSGIYVYCVLRLHDQALELSITVFVQNNFSTEK